MRKLIFIIILFLNFSNFFYSKVIIKDYNKSLTFPVNTSSEVKNEDSSEKKTTFSFRLGNVDGDINLYGYWKLKLGYGGGFTLFPDVEWILTKKGFTNGLIFEQKRLFSLDWIADNGIYLHLFFNDNVDETEFTFRYDVNKFFNSFYITNKFKEYQVNPYRSLKGGKTQDINFGFDMGNRIYKGRFDVQFDSVYYKTESFKGGKKDISNKQFSNQYVRGIYYYLPDDIIVGAVEVYVTDSNGILFDDGNKYARLNENVDYVIDPQYGYIKFNQSVYTKQAIIFYQTRINGNIYKVGDNGTKSFTFGAEYFTANKGVKYLKLSLINTFSMLEEKNSYRIASPRDKVSKFNVDILTKGNDRLAGFKVSYDEYTGCLRIVKSSVKGDQYNKYPFYDSVDTGVFYLNYYSPGNQYANNIIDYSALVQSDSLRLSYKPVVNSIKVMYNSVLLEQSKFSYDTINNSIIINFETSNSDFIEISYLTDQEEAYNLTLAYKNDFRLNQYLILGDSYWYKMPIKLWEESYYDKPHAVEFLYNVHLISDFHKFLQDDKSGKLGFNLNAGFSMYYPELKGMTLVDDFERELTGYKLNLNYLNWFPVNLPSATVFGDLVTATKGRLYYRNLHQNGNIQNSTFVSINDPNATARESYSSGNRIGPYSSSDGFTYDVTNNKFEDRENTLSLITEIDLAANQAISIVFPITSVNEMTDFSLFTGLNLALKKEDLNGDLRIYVDAGLVTEKFNSTDSTVQKETLDEGLDYYISSDNIHLLKGRHDGVVSTNDLDNNGQLDDEITSSITKITDPTAAVDYVSVQNRYNNFTLKIFDPTKLKSMRGVRLTLYSQNGATGRLIFNQIRFTESGWIFPKTTSSTAQEISPIEDTYLINHIFSRENPDIDKILHYQRFKERTMRVSIESTKDFQIEKSFSHPVDVSNFSRFTIFALMKEKSNRQIKVTMTDTYGNEMYDKINLGNLANNEWQRLDYYIDSLSGANKNNKLITKIRVDFENGFGEATDPIFYLDEFCLSDARPSFGFASKNEFLYSEPGLIIKKEDFTVFKSPYLKYTATFNTPNFLKTEFTQYKDYFYNNDLITSFTLAEVDYIFHSNMDFIFKENYTYNPAETLKIKMSKYSTEFSPFLFTINYDYKKLGYADAFGVLSTENISHDRRLFLELGGNFGGYSQFKFNYDVDSIYKTTVNTASRYSTDYTLNFNGFYYRVGYSIFNEINSTVFNGRFSLDNLGYLLREDFIKFYYNGNKKGQEFNTKYGFFLVDPIYLSHGIIVKHNGSNYNTIDVFKFTTDFSHNLSIDLYLTYLDKKSIFFRIDYSRDAETVLNTGYFLIDWSQYYNEFNNSIAYIMPLIFYPPFSSLYKKDNGERYIDEKILFNFLNDKLRLTWDWSMYLKRHFFLPNSFSFSFTEATVNNVFYDPTYYYTFILSGSGEKEYDMLILTNNYSVTEIVGIRSYENTFNTVWSYTTGFNLLNKVEFDFTFTYDQLYINGLLNKEIDHKFIFINFIYSNFFQKNRLTNDKYGFEISFMTEISSLFHNKLNNQEITKVDNPLNIDLTPKIGYRFNKNFTLNNIVKFGYTLDYSQVTKNFVNRFGIELSSEGVFTF